MKLINRKKLVCAICLDANSTTSFHIIPTDERRKIWLNALKCTENVPKTTRICSKHFSENSFHERNENDRIQRKRLKKNAIPTLFLSEGERDKYSINLDIAPQKKRKKKFTCVICGPRSLVDYSLHRFPLNKERTDIWVQKLGIQGKYPEHKLNDLRLCSDHFSRTDFVENPWTNVKLLKKHANPIEIRGALDMQLNTDQNQSPIEESNCTEIETADTLLSQQKVRIT